MKLSEWLAYLEKLHPQNIELGLERIQVVAKALGLAPFLSARASPTVITVTGTNGKGSCVATLAAIYLAADYQVATYTSPHLWKFTERIQINQQAISEAALCNALEKVEQARGKTSLTYFEFTTLAALWIFQQQKLDVIILEVGMGGRLDAVNIVDADIAVITTVDLDHQTWLGETREQIGFEKAGICRAGRPLVCGENMPKSVYQMAQQLKCTTYRLGKEFFLQTLPKSNLLIHNIALSLQVVKLLQNRHPVTAAQIELGISQCRLPGRQQLVEKPVWQMFDVAHNPQSVSALAQRLAQPTQHSRTLAVFSMLRDKALPESLESILPYIDEWHVAGLAVERGMTTAEVAESVQQIVARTVYAYPTIRDAYLAACEQAAKQNGRVVIFGSFHTVADAVEGL